MDIFGVFAFIMIVVSVRWLDVRFLDTSCE